MEIEASGVKAVISEHDIGQILKYISTAELYVRELKSFNDAFWSCEHADWTEVDNLESYQVAIFADFHLIKSCDPIIAIKAEREQCLRSMCWTQQDEDNYQEELAKLEAK